MYTYSYGNMLEFIIFHFNLYIIVHKYLIISIVYFLLFRNMWVAFLFVFLHRNISELSDIRKRSVLSHLLSSYNIPREVTPTPRNALMIIKYILRKSDHSLNSLQHALQVLSTYCLLFWKRTRTTVSLTCVGNLL